MLTDICVNLLNSQFREDRGAVIDRADAAGVTRMMITATDLATSYAALDLCVAGARYTTAGIHPHDIGSAGDDWREALVNIARDERVRAIGETGLDFNRNFSPRDTQCAGFEEHIRISLELGKPLFVHDRESNGEVLRLLISNRRGMSEALPPVVIHCFTGSERELIDYLDAGFSIGITGWVCDTRRGEELRRIVPLIPLDRLMLETDAPFLRPHNAPSDFVAQHALPARFKRRNEPALLPSIVSQVATLYQCEADEIAAATRSNADSFFGFD